MSDSESSRGDQDKHAARRRELARLLAVHSAAVQPGENVLIWGPTCARRFIRLVADEVAAAGGTVIDGLRAGRRRRAARRILDQAAACIMVESGWPPKAAVGWDGSPVDLYFHLLDRFNDGQLRWSITLDPDAGQRRPAASRWRRLFYRACLLGYPDPARQWQTAAQAQQRLCDFLEEVSEIHVTTSAGTDLRLGIAGRRWVNCDGRLNMPGGEVFTAPIETAIDGRLFLPGQVTYAGLGLRDLCLEFSRGELTHASARRGQHALDAILHSDDGARVLGELAIGCNYHLTRFTGHPLMDEKIGGTFHVAFGKSYPQCGGVNRSQIHWDLVVDLRSGGRITADGTVINDTGRFTRPEWPQPPET